MRMALFVQDQERVQALVSLLLDTTAPLADRDDAAIDLGALAEEGVEAATGADVEDALVTIATDPAENPTLHETAGESLAELWLAANRFPRETHARLMPKAKSEARALIELRRPDWLSSIQ